MLEQPAPPAAVPADAGKRRRAGRRLPPALLLPALLVAAGVALPLAYLVLRAFEAEPAALREIVFRQRNLALLGNTLLLTVGVLAASVAVALPLAWLTVRSDLKWRFLIVPVGVLPLAVPGYVGAYALLAASGEGGLIDAVTSFAWPRPSGYLGALGVLTLFTFPYLYLNLWAALRGLDPSQEEAARSLGLSPLGVLRRVTLPALRPALYAGGLLVALHVLGDFGVVSLMRYETFSYAISLQYNASFDRVYAAWLSLMLIAVTIGALFLEAKLLSGVRLARTGSGAQRSAPLTRLGPWRLPAAAFVALIAGASLLVPLASIVYWLGQGLAGGAATDLAEVLVNSVLVSAPAAVLATALSVPLAVLGVRYASKRTRLLERAAYLGYATPPLAFALALVFFTLRAAPALYQTLALLTLAYALHFLAEAVGPVRSRLYQATPRLEEAARSLGLSPLRAAWRVTLPLVRPGLLASFALVFLSALKELPLTFILSPVGFDTLARGVWSYTSEAMFAEAAPYALLLVLVSSVAAALLLGGSRRRE